MDFLKYPAKKLYKLYNGIKISVDPYNYVLSKRMIPTAFNAMWCKNIALKNIVFEKNLVEKTLGKPISVIGSAVDLVNHKYDCGDSAVLDDTTWLKYINMLGYNNQLLSLNNLYISNQLVLALERLLHPSKDLSKIGNVEAFEFDDIDAILPYVESFVKIYEKCIGKHSLIPYLFYLVTNLGKQNFEDIVNLKTLKETIANEDTIQDVIPSPAILNLASAAFVSDNLPIYYKYEYCGNIYIGTSMHSTTYELCTFMTHCKYVGGILTCIYACEVMYQLYKLLESDDKYHTDLYCEMFNFEYEEHNDCNLGKLFYHFESGYIKINDDILDAFDDDMSKRFNNFRMLAEIKQEEFEEIWRKCTSKDEVYTPRILSMLCANLNTYALQRYRLDVAELLILNAKSKGIRIRDVAKGSSSSSLAGSVEEDDSDDTGALMDTDSLEYDEDEEDDVDLDDDDEEESTKKFTPVSKKSNLSKDADNAAIEDLELLASDLDKCKYKFQVIPMKNTMRVEEYNKVSSKIDFLATLLSKKIKEIKTYNVGGKNPGQRSGKLDKKNLWKYKQSQDIFYNNTYKIKEMDLAFGIILDQSGSMCGDGIANGRVSMILLHKVLNSLKINHSIIGHDSLGHHQSRIYTYYYFNEERQHNIQTPYNLLNMKALRGNCDSGALYYMQSLFKRVHNKDKICIIFSDGQPTECTGTELKTQVKNMEKEGIHVIGVGINFESIKEYYSDNANGKNLIDMCNIIVNILTTYVLEKKD